MLVDTREKLEKELSKVGIVGEWINPDKYGFSRLYKFNACGTDVIIVWYYNYSTIKIKNVRKCFTQIDTCSGYPEKGKWIELSFKNDQPLYLKVKE